MKILNKILIVLIFIVIIFLIKNDYKSIYSKTLSFLQGEVGKSSVMYQNTVNDFKKQISKEINNDKTQSKVVAPGALIVPDDLLTNNINNIKLTIKGVISISNKERELNGNLAPLKENSKLDFSAEKKLQDMFVKGYFEHISPEGVGVSDLGNQAGYEYIIIGENLALGNFKNDKALVDAWMASPGHRANILNKRYTEIGVAVGLGTYKGKSVWMAVQHFALPKSACPSINAVLKGIIDIDQKNIKAMEGDLASRKAQIDSGAVSDGKTTNEQIDIYNALVNEYNKLIISIKEKINTYNGEVRDFNNCLAEVN